MKASPKIQVLTPEQIKSIHDASLAILEDVGVEVRHPGVLKMLADFGSGVSTAEGRVRFPASLVEQSLQQAGRRYIHYGRDLTRAARFGYGDTLVLSSAGQYAWVDPVAKKRRGGTAEDLRRAIAVGHALDELDIVGGMILPEEIPSAYRDVFVHAELVKGTTKPCTAWIHNGASARYVLEMYKVLAGSARRLEETPMVTGFVEPISPLQYTREGLEVLIELARVGAPVGFGPMAMAMATAPATLAGTLALENAEILAGVTIAQVISPGLPVCYWGIPHIMDARTGNISFGSPEQGLMAAAMVQVGKSYGLPVGVNAGLTDAKIPDAQSGIEKAASLVLAAIAGADVFGHMGISGADQGASLPQLIIDNEIAGYVRRIVDGFAVNSESLAVEAIKKVGIGGQFLVEEHTLSHFRTEQWFSRLCDRNQWEVWSSRGAPSMLERAVQEEQRLLEHACEPLAPELAAEIDSIVEAARTELLEG